MVYKLNGLKKNKNKKTLKYTLISSHFTKAEKICTEGLNAVFLRILPGRTKSGKGNVCTPNCVKF